MKRILCLAPTLALASSAQAWLFGPKGDRNEEKKSNFHKQRDGTLAQLRTFVAGLLAFCAISLVGCQSAKQPGSMSHASVQIQGHSPVEIQPTTTAVFREQGYALAVASQEQMVFERPGTRRDAAKWGGWSGEGVTMRVKVRLSKMLDGAHLLQADAYAMQNSDDEFFRTESRNILLNRRPYQKLLEETARRLK